MYVLFDLIMFFLCRLLSVEDFDCNLVVNLFSVGITLSNMPLDILTFQNPAFDMINKSNNILHLTSTLDSVANV